MTDGDGTERVRTDRRHPGGPDDAVRDGLGVTRRDMLRRGAVVAGTLLWAVPAIESIAPSARASTESGRCASCYCWHRTNAGTGTLDRDLCITDGVFPGIPTASAEDCATFCASFRTPSGGRLYNGSDYCQGTSCRCSSLTANNPAPYGVDCS